MSHQSTVQEPLKRTTSIQTSNSAAWYELLFVVVVEVLVSRQRGKERRLVPDLRQFCVVTAKIKGTILVRSSRMNTGRWIGTRGHTDRVEVNGRNTRQLVKLSIQTLVILDDGIV